MKQLFYPKTKKYLVYFQKVGYINKFKQFLNSRNAHILKIFRTELDKEMQSSELRQFFCVEEVFLRALNLEFTVTWCSLRCQILFHRQVIEIVFPCWRKLLNKMLFKKGFSVFSEECEIVFFHTCLWVLWTKYAFNRVVVLKWGSTSTVLNGSCEIFRKNF